MVGVAFCNSFRRKTASKFRAAVIVDPFDGPEERLRPTLQVSSGKQSGNNSLNTFYSKQSYFASPFPSPPGPFLQ